MDTEPKNIEQPEAEESATPKEDHTLPLPDPSQKGTSRFERFKNWYLDRKKLTIPATALLFLVIMAGIPFTRYAAVGLVLKKEYSLKVVDSTTKDPVSGALVSAGSISAETDGNGRAVLKKLPVGTRHITVTKKHYKTGSSSYLVPITGQKNTPSISLEATGRQVVVKVVNYVTNKPLPKVEIKVSDVNAVTDKDGQALLVLPASDESHAADLNLKNYLSAKVNVTLSDQQGDDANTFKLVPSGSIYFMSKRTGKLDLMKSNIDGSDAKVVVPATGSEQDYRTSLVPSPGFEHVAYQAKRSSSDPSPQLYILTSDEKLQNIDSGNAEFYIHGWAGHNLIYSLTRNDLPIWQQGKHKLKSYDAESGKITMLDQSAGSDEAANAGESYSMIAITGSTITYAKAWNSFYYGTALTGKQHSLHSISAGGQNHKMVSAYDAEKYSMQFRQRSPSGFYIYQNGEGDEGTYFEYSAGGQPKQVSIDQDKFYESFPTYIQSPNGQASVWTDLRDGKDVILIGDASGNNAKNIASLDEYGIYGWFSDDYLVLSKKNNELYVMSVEGGDPLKITGYQSVNGTYRYY